MRVAGKILYGFFILLIVAVAGLFLTSLLPIPGKFEVKIVKSGSMEPAILTGAIVVVRPETSYAVGDVITFGEDTKRQIPTTHRIYSEEQKDGITYFTTKGDANEDPDPDPVKQNDVIGKVLFNVPYAGYILDFARQPVGFALLIGIPAGIIILDELGRIFKEILAIRRKKRKLAEENNITTG